MINRLFLFTRAAASGATVTSLLCAYHCYHYTNECSVTQRTAMASVGLYATHADELERNVKQFKATGEKRLSQQIDAARQQQQLQQ